ncbi:MAG: tetratricopeptide repeat protein [Steroidobacteraceae bacterium]
MSDTLQLEAARTLCLNHQYEAAASVLSGLVHRSPWEFDAWILLSQLHLYLRNQDLAFKAASIATTLKPADPEAHYALGRAHKARGETDAAEAAYRRAMEASPGNPNILTSLGILVRGKGRVDEAIALYQRALTAKPDHLEAKINLGTALAIKNASTAGAAHPERAPSALEEEIDQLRESAIALAKQRKLDAALSVLNRALRIAPGTADLWLKAGAVATEMGLPPYSLLPYFEEAVRLDPSCVPALDLAQKICFSGGLPQRVMRYSRLLYELAPCEETLIAQKLFLPAIQPSRDAIHATRRLYEQGLDEALAADLHPSEPYNSLQFAAFFLAYHGECDRELQVKAARMYLKMIPGLAMTASHCERPSRRDGRIRVGFISRYLASHSIGKTTRGLIAKLGRDRFEVYALRIMPSADDETTRLICRLADHEIVLDRDVPRAREQIASLELDILFYQDIGMEPVSYFLAFARLARVQCVSFGHPNTTGIPNIDYFVSNDLYETPGAQAHYSERLFLLHDLPTLAYYYKPEIPAAPFDRQKFGLDAGATLYVCAQALFKIHPDFDDLIRGILTRDPLGVVLFIRGGFEQWTQMLQQRFARTLGARARRVIFLPGMDLNAFLQLLAMADVVLDTVHFNGMNSSLESFAVGTPVVTLPTQLQRGRHTQAMYRKMGILDGIASNPEHYVDIAVRLGTDRAYARDVRERILARNDALFEDPRVIEEFERFFIEALRVKSAM